MKKLLIIAVLAIATTSSFAQDRIAFGLKTGFNSTKIKLSDIPDNETIKNEANNGFLFGAYGRLRLFGNLTFQPELYYAKKQSDISVVLVEGQPKESFDVTFHTWDIPLLVNIRLLDLKVASVYGVAGPVASFNANTKTDLPGYEDVDSANWTFQAGAGVEFWRLTADVRYEWGMKDISKVDIGQKTNVLTFAVGFKLFGI
ncbi:PorT family protein [Carboxylicivirga sp. A043]|uniref:porin family protein n=1 Tax=Carboxylicivirga litoralis TaxID=2816963 RepID=UPI0021CAFF91|nr:porin family protein [Carboxylicivirga sp. A043]MCU4157184.1 PorT family protein [Carboxylicivirga sp. A043]